jgi:hypothetical protein
VGEVASYGCGMCEQCHALAFQRAAQFSVGEKAVDTE